jgi:chromosome segregation ATPase
MVMTEEEKLLRKIQDLQSELDKKEIQINRQLDKLDGQETEIMKYEQMFDENAPKSKIKKAKEEKLNIEINARDREIRELKDRMGFLRKEKIDLQKKYELEVKKNTETSVISVEELRAKDKAPLNVLLQELQDKINKQQSMIRRLKRGEIGLKSKDSGSDEFNEMLKEKDKKIEMLTDQIASLDDQIAELNNNLSKTGPKVELDDKPPSSNISKILLEELQNNLTKVKRRNNELKKKLEKYEKKITSKEGSEENSHVLELQNIISQLTSELEHKNKIIEENTISSIHRESESDADSLHSVVEELKSKLSKAKSQIASFQLAQEHSFKSLSPSETEGKLKIQREMASFLQKQLAEANNSLKTKEEEITTIKTEAIGIKRKYEQLNNLLKSKDQETNELYADIEALKMQIQTQNAPSQSIHPDVKLRLKELQSLVDDLSKQTIQQRLEISQLRKSKQ